MMKVKSDSLLLKNNIMKKFLYSISLSETLLLIEKEDIIKKNMLTKQFIELFGNMHNLHEADNSVEYLKQGVQVVFYHNGFSIHLDPIDKSTIFNKKDVVLIQVGSYIYLFLIGDLDKNRIQVFNKTKINGWINKKNIVGKLISIKKIIL